MFVDIDTRYPVLNSGLCGESVIYSYGSMSSDIGVYVAIMKVEN